MDKTETARIKLAEWVVKDMNAQQRSKYAKTVNDEGKQYIIHSYFACVYDNLVDGMPNITTDPKNTGVVKNIAEYDYTPVQLREPITVAGLKKLPSQRRGQRLVMFNNACVNANFILKVLPSLSGPVEYAIGVPKLNSRIQMLRLKAKNGTAYICTLSFPEDSFPDVYNFGGQNND